MTDEAFDVVVVGGGPAGVAAAVAASRVESRVALVERESMLGGAGTVNLVNNFINAYWDGSRYVIGGIFLEMRDRLLGRKAMYRTRGPAQESKHGQEPFDPDIYADELETICREAGVELLLDSTVTSAVVEGERIASLALESRAVTGGTIVDATGGATLAANTGVGTRLGGSEAPQPLTYMYMVAPVDLDALESFLPRAVMYDETTDERWADLSHLEEVNALVREAKGDGELSLPVSEITSLRSVPRHPTRFAVNFGYVQVDDPTDEDQLAMATEEGKRQIVEGVEFLRAYVPGFSNVQIQKEARRIGVRESRRIEGVYELTAQDVATARQFDDVIAQSCFPFDIHRADGEWGWEEDLFDEGEHYDIPLRSLIPRSGPDNLVVAGKCISADQVAFSSLRVSSSAMAIGQAAGITAAIAAENDQVVEHVDRNLVQAELNDQRAILS